MSYIILGNGHCFYFSGGLLSNIFPINELLRSETPLQENPGFTPAKCPHIVMSKDLKGTC